MIDDWVRYISCSGSKGISMDYSRTGTDTDKTNKRNERNKTIIISKTSKINGPEKKMNVADVLMNELYGRRLVLTECSPDLRAAISDTIEKNTKAVVIEDAVVNGKCQRCGNKDPSRFYPTPCKCSSHCTYCLDCLPFHRIKSCSKLVSLSQPLASLASASQDKETRLMTEFSLSPAQERVSKEVTTAFLNRQSHLVWAVTGAGKTEMSFQAIKEGLDSGMCIAYVSPRVDVCIELRRRYQNAFPDLTIPLLYGGSEELYEFQPFMMMTTHQLIRFYRAFDAIIIDEGDAFPFVDSDMLKRAIDLASKECSSRLWLTATPPSFLIKQVKEKTLSQSVLPSRFHGHPLAVPRSIYIGPWQQAIDRLKLSYRLLKLLTRYYDSGNPFLVFLPDINRMLKLESVIQKAFPSWSFTSVSSEDEERPLKIQKMHDGNYRFILTTTILERGVTFPNIDVIVLGSENETFTTESLVQIAGRVGRNPDRPKGDVIWLHNGQTRAMKRAKKQIVYLNRLKRQEDRNMSQ